MISSSYFIIPPPKNTKHVFFVFNKTDSKAQQTNYDFVGSHHISLSLIKDCKENTDHAPAEEEAVFVHVDFAGRLQDLGTHLEGEQKLVSLKQTTAGVSLKNNNHDFTKAQKSMLTLLIQQFLRKIYFVKTAYCK